MIQEPPTHKGTIAQAWKLDSTANPLVLASYLVHAPHAHLCWAWHIIALVTLEDAADTPPAVRYFPGAEFEVLCLALDGDVTSLNGPWRYLTPPDVVIQFNCVTKAQAITLLDDIAKRIAAGALVPDSDFRRHWQLVLSSLLPTGATVAEPPYRGPQFREPSAS